MVKEKASVKSSVLDVKEAKEKTTEQNNVPRSTVGNIGGNKSLGKFIVYKKNHLYL